MKSNSKFIADDATVVKLFESAGIKSISNISPLGAGEFNSIYAADADGIPYALKISQKDSTHSLTYETEMMRQEIYYYSRFAEAGLSVPKIYHTDFTKKIIPADWFIMERLGGKTVDATELSEAERDEVMRLTVSGVAKLHAIPAEGGGYLQTGLKDNWYDAIALMINNILTDAAHFRKKSRRGEKLLRYVEKNEEILANVECSLIHFDLWSSNLIVGRAENGLRLFWIDPERCLFGDPVADFVCLESLKTSLDAKTKSLGIYNEVSAKKIAVGNGERIRYAVMLGYLALVMEVEKYARYTPFHFGWWRNVAVSRVHFRNAFHILKTYTKN